MAGFATTRAVFVDLDRTLLRRASSKALHAALETVGISRSLPGNALLYAVYDRFGENVPDAAVVTAAISALLPPDARVRRQSSDEELARTYPPGHRDA